MDQMSTITKPILSIQENPQESEFSYETLTLTGPERREFLLSGMCCAK